MVATAMVVAFSGFSGCWEIGCEEEGEGREKRGGERGGEGERRKGGRGGRGVRREGRREGRGGRRSSKGVENQTGVFCRCYYKYL